MIRRSGDGPSATKLRVSSPVIVYTSLMSLLALPAASSAQAQGWSLETQAGRVSYDVSGAPLGVSNLIVAIRYAGLDGSWLQAATAVPLEEANPLWGALAAGTRASRLLGRFTVGLDLGGYGFLQEDRSSREALGPVPFPREEPDNSGFGVTGEVLPLVGVLLGPLVLEGRAGGAAYHSSFADSAFTRSVALADARLSFSPGLRALLSTELRNVWADGESFPYVGGMAVVSEGDLSLWGNAGKWLHDDVETIPWAIGASLALGSRVHAIGSAREEAYDPLYQSLPRRSWSVGLSLSLGGGSPALAEPVPAAYSDGQATIVLDAGEAAGAPSVAGDFTEWEPRPMQRVGNEWRWTGPLSPGVYHFSFVGDSGEWFVPEGYPGRQDDGMGGWVAVLVVGAG